MQHAFGKSFVKLTLSRLITTGIAMIISTVLSRYLTLTEYGTYSQVILIATLAVSLCSLGLPESINYFMMGRWKDPESQGRFLSLFFTMTGLIGGVIALVLAVASPLIAGMFRNPLISSFVLVMAVYPWTTLITNSMDNLLIVYGHTGLLLAYRIVFSASLLGSVFLCYAAGASFVVFMVVFLGVNAAFALAGYVLIYAKAQRFRLLLDKAMLREIFAFSIPMAMAGIVGRVNIELGKLLIGNLFSTEDMAVYLMTAQELPFALVTSALTALLLPLLVQAIRRGDTDGALRIWGESHVVCYYILAFCAAVLFVYAPEAVTLLYTEKYLAGVTVFRIYSLILLMRATYYGMLLNCLGKSREILLSSAASLAVNLLLAYGCYLIWGFHGPAVGMLLCVVIINVLQLVLTSRSIRYPFGKLFPWKRLGAITLLNGGLAAAFVLVRAFFPSHPVLVLLVWTVAYVILIRKRLVACWQGMTTHADEITRAAEEEPVSAV